QPPAAYATGVSPASLLIASLPDGNSVIMTPDQESGNIWVSIVSPDGVVGAPPYYVVGSASGVALADLDGDGVTDAVVAGQRDVKVLLTRDGHVQLPVSYPVTGTGVAVGDLNGDGIPDVVVGGSTVLLGNGDGTLQAPKRTPLNVSPQSFALADFNGDG